MYLLGENRRSVGESAPESPLTTGGWGLRSQTPTLLLTLTINYLQLCRVRI